MVFYFAELAADDSPTWRQDSFHNKILGTVMGISFAVAKLLDFANRDKELLASRNPFALVTLAHLRTQQTGRSPAKRYAAKWQLTKLLLQRGWSKKRIMILFKVVNWMMTLPEPLQLRYRRAVIKLERSSQMEWIDPYDLIRLRKAEKKVEKAEEKAEKAEEKAEKAEEKAEMAEEKAEKAKQKAEKAAEKGREEGAAIVLERLLTHRFGPLPKTVKSKLTKASVEQLSAWSESVLEAQSLRQVFK